MGHLLTSLPTQVMPKLVPQELTGAVTHNNVLCTHIWHKLVQPFASYHDITDITSSSSFFQTAIALLRVSYTFV